MKIFDFISQTSYSFEGKKGDENVELFLHRHWFSITNRITFMALGIFFPLIPFLIFGQAIVENKLLPLFMFAWSCYLMFVWYAIFYTLTMYTLDYWIVTDERIIDNKQNGFFDRSISELDLSSIQDIKVTLTGLIPTLLNFGFVEVQTAARDKHFSFEDVPTPQDVKDIVMELADKEERREGNRHL
jgi:Bacterial PH domain